MHKTLAILNFSIIGYFLFLYLVYVFRIDLHIIGVVREMLTIPAMLGQLVLIVLGVILFVKKERNPMLLISLVMLIICAILTIGSFFL